MEENENIEEVQNEETVQEEQVEEQESPVSYKDDGTIVLDMNKINELENAVQEQNTDEVSVRDESETSEEVRGENVQAADEQVTEQSEEPTEELKELVQEANDAIQQSEKTGDPLPANIEKLIGFMNETGGSVEDYVRLNQDYSDMDNLTALNEYYKITKPHLSAEERDFMMDDQLSFDEEVDDDREIRRKKLALKEQVAEAKAYLDGQKSKYYDEIKAKPIVSDEYQKAMDFFNRYNQEVEDNQRVAEERSNVFVEKTNNLFNNDFKGFEYKVGDKSFYYNVKEPNKVKETQSDINNFISKYIDSEGKITNAGEYHRALYAAMNADALAQHFYEQGKADALKENVAKAKNIDMSPRASYGEVESNGIKVRALDLDTTPSFKFKKRN